MKIFIGKVLAAALFFFEKDIMVHHPSWLPAEWGIGNGSSEISIYMMSGLFHPILAFDHLLFLVGLILLRSSFPHRFPVYSLFIGGTLMGAGLHGLINFADFFPLLSLTILALIFAVEMPKLSQRGQTKVASRSWKFWQTCFGKEYFDSKRIISSLILCLFIVFSGFVHGSVFGDDLRTDSSAVDYSIYLFTLLLSQSLVLLVGHYSLAVIIRHWRKKQKKLIYMAHSLYIFLCVAIWILYIFNLPIRL